MRARKIFALFGNNGPSARVIRSHHFYLIFLISFFSNISFSQSFYIKRYTVNDGLPASYIFRIYQDSNGFLWISTYNGLSRFDGKEFVNYGYQEGMPHIIADAIYEDKHHRVWIGTRNGMAEIKDRHCVVYPVDDGQTINYVFRFRELQSGDLWALTGRGVYQFEKDHWKKIKLYNGFENHACTDVIETKDGMLINYAHYLVTKKRSGSFQLIGQINYDDAPGPFYNQLYEQDDHWYLNRVDGFFEIEGKDTTALFKDELRDKYILHTYKDKAGRFWVYTLKNQLMVSAPGDKQHFIYKTPMRLVSGFCEDKEGNMWVAGLDGLLKMKAVDYDSYDKSFTPHVTGNCSVITIPGGRLLVSAAGNNLFSISSTDEGNPIKKYPVKQSDTHYEIIDYWCSDDKGRTFLIFREEGDLFMLQNNQLKFLNGLVKENIHPLTGVAYSARTHKLYVCADSFQCGDEKELHVFKSTNGGRRLVWPICIHYFSNGRLLVGTRNDGFFIIDEQDNIYPVPKADISYQDAAGSTRIFEDPSRVKFWIASSFGLVRYRWDEKLVPKKELEITTKQRLPNNGVRSIAFDTCHRIWAATLQGIVVIEIDSSTNQVVRVNRFSEDQGINAEYWAEARLATDAQGTIWAGLTNQLLKFDPSAIQFQKTPPAIVIDSVQLNSKETNWSQWADSIDETTRIPYSPIFPYNKNNIDIFFRGISFSSSGLEYSYRLQGNDSSWSVPTGSDFVSFLGLPPGRYAFQVKARKSNTEWSKPATFSFTILKPFWATWGFRISLVIVALAVVYILYRYRINHLKRLLVVRTKIARDLHDEIGSTLSGLGMLSEVAIQQLDHKRIAVVKDLLYEINLNSEQTLEKMSDIVWAINPQNDNFEKIINRLRSYARNATESLGIDLHFNTEKDVERYNLEMLKRNNIYLICKEAINNAIKYSQCQNLSFHMRQEDHHINICIADDGKGFDAKQSFDGNGLKNMRSRAKEIKADLDFNSEKGRGTVINLLLKIT